MLDETLGKREGLMIRKALIVSPHFPPVSAPDMQRARILLPHFVHNGWQVHVLAVSPKQVASPVDEWLLEGLPADVPVHRVNALGLGWARVPGLGSLGFRSLLALARAGDSLLEKGGFDVVFFSTTVFEVHLLGPRWKRRFGVPFVMDYQDPWVNDYYSQRATVVPPGGRMKYAIVDALHRMMEPWVLRECAGIVSVSPDYPRQIAARYPTIQRHPTLVQAFPGARSDFERTDDVRVSQDVFDPKDGCIHWVYAGVVVPGMLPTIRALFRAIRDTMPREDLERLRMHFIGTSYAKRGTALPCVLPVAREYGLERQVREQCERAAYATVLACLGDADALLAVGSDDPAYTASKIFPYLLARKPLLAIFHEQSSIIELLNSVGGATYLSFGAGFDEVALADAITKSWLIGRAYSMVLPLDAVAFEPHTEKGCAAALCGFLKECASNDSN